MTLIQQLSEGKIALNHTGSLEDLRRVLKAAFPRDISNANGKHKYFYGNINSGLWFCTDFISDISLLTSFPISEFIKELDNQTTMKKITSQQAQSIIDVACEAWKENLYQKWGKDIVFKKDINITEEFYQDMRKVCTAEQNKLFDGIFGKDEPRFKVGDYFTVVEECCGYNGKKGETYKVTEITNNLLFYAPNDSVCTKMVKVRPATPEEIKKAQYLPEGTPCFVRGSVGSHWKLAYADGNGMFTRSKKSGGELFHWRFVHEVSKGLPEK